MELVPLLTSTMSFNAIMQSMAVNGTADILAEQMVMTPGRFEGRNKRFGRLQELYV